MKTAKPIAIMSALTITFISTMAMADTFWTCTGDDVCYVENIEIRADNQFTISLGINQHAGDSRCSNKARLTLDNINNDMEKAKALQAMFIAAMTTHTPIEFYRVWDNGSGTCAIRGARMIKK